MQLRIYDLSWANSDKTRGFQNLILYTWLKKAWCVTQILFWSYSK